MTASKHQSPYEMIRVAKQEVACDGDKGPSGHPRVFLHIDREKGEITCPYCSRLYVLDGNGHH